MATSTGKKYFIDDGKWSTQQLKAAGVTAEKIILLYWPELRIAHFAQVELQGLLGRSLKGNPLPLLLICYAADLRAAETFVQKFGRGDRSWLNLRVMKTLTRDDGGISAHESREIRDVIGKME